LRANTLIVAVRAAMTGAVMVVMKLVTLPEDAHARKRSGPNGD